jgi:hypothetical protein
MFQTEYEGDEEASEDEPEASDEGQEEAENEEGANEEAANEEGAETPRPRVARADEEKEAADSLEAMRIDEAVQSTVSDKEQGENPGDFLLSSCRLQSLFVFLLPTHASGWWI